jgi:hypothetical protein
LTPDVLQWLAANPRGGAFNGYFYSPQGGYEIGNADIGTTTAPVTGWNRAVLPAGARSIGTTPQGVAAYNLPEDTQHEAFGLDGAFTHNWTGQRSTPLLRDLAIFAALAKVRWYRLLADHIHFVDNSKGFGHREEFAPG